MKVSVISWTWVSACISEIVTPTNIATNTVGAQATRTVKIADWTRSTASTSVIAYETSIPSPTTTMSPPARVA